MIKVANTYKYTHRHKLLHTNTFKHGYISTRTHAKHTYQQASNALRVAIDTWSSFQDRHSGESAPPPALERLGRTRVGERGNRRPAECFTKRNYMLYKSANTPEVARLGRRLLQRQLQGPTMNINLM